MVLFASKLMKKLCCVSISDLAEVGAWRRSKLGKKKNQTDLGF